MWNLSRSLRSVVRHPLFALALGASLALGVGMNAAAYSLIEAVLLRPFPYAEPDRLVLLWASRSTDVRGGFTDSTLEAIRVGSTAFVSLVPIELAPRALSVDSNSATTVEGAFVGPEFSAVLGVSPVIGTAFSETGAAQAGSDQVMISYGLWQSMFGGTTAIAGFVIRLDGRTHTVVGVMPRGFFFPDQSTQVWLPLVTTPGVARLQALARLRPGVSVQLAQGEVDRVMSAGDGKRQAGGQVGVHSIYRAVVGEYELAFTVLAGIIFVLLALTCANAAHLLLAHWGSRRDELAIRAALGASPVRLLRLQLTELAIVSLAATAVGLLIAGGGVRLVQAMGLRDIVSIDVASMNWRVVVCAVLSAVVVAMSSILVPALTTLTGTRIVGLHYSPGGSTDRKQHHLQGALLIVESAAATSIVITCALLIVSFVRLSTASWGFQPENLLVAHVLQRDLSSFRVPAKATTIQSSAERDFVASFTERLMHMPAVQSVAASRDIPLFRIGWNYHSLALDGRLLSIREPLVDAIGPDYFRTMGVKILEGREFLSNEPLETPKAIINRKLASQLWPGVSALGRRISLVTLDTSRPDVAARLARKDVTVRSDASVWSEVGGAALEVIGVVENVRMLGLDIEPEATVFTDYRRRHRSSINIAIVIRVRESPEMLIPHLSQALAGTQADAKVHRVAVVKELVFNSIGGRSSNGLLTAVSIVFGSLAVILAALGVFSVSCHVCAARMKECRVRLAIGARPDQVIRLLLVQILRPVLVGVTLGGALAWVASSSIESLLFGVGRSAWWFYAVLCCCLFAIAAASAVLPSLSISRHGPQSVLRGD